MSYSSVLNAAKAELIFLFTFTPSRVRFHKTTCQLARTKSTKTWVVVVAQLVVRSLPTPEVHSSNPVIGKIYIEHCLLSTKLIYEIKKKVAGNIPFYRKYLKSVDITITT